MLPAPYRQRGCQQCARERRIVRSRLRMCWAAVFVINIIFSGHQIRFTLSILILIKFVMDIYYRNVTESSPEVPVPRATGSSTNQTQVWPRVHVPRSGQGSVMGDVTRSTRRAHVGWATSCWWTGTQGSGSVGATPRSPCIIMQKLIRNSLQWQGLQSCSTAVTTANYIFLWSNNSQENKEMNRKILRLQFCKHHSCSMRQATFSWLGENWV